MKIEIRNRWNGAVIFTHEADGATMRDAVLAHMRAAGPVAELIASGCVIDEDGCMTWSLSSSNGRARVTVDGKPQYINRAMWTAAFGPIPEGMMVCHTCDNGLCAAPAHLFLGTHEDNMRDMAAKGRSTKGRSLSQSHRLKLAMAGRGKTHTLETKAAITASIKAHFSAKRAAFAPAPAA